MIIPDIAPYGLRTVNPLDNHENRAEIWHLLCFVPNHIKPVRLYRLYINTVTLRDLSDLILHNLLENLSSSYYAVSGLILNIATICPFFQLLNKNPPSWADTKRGVLNQKGGFLSALNGLKSKSASVSNRIISWT